MLLCYMSKNNLSGENDKKKGQTDGNPLISAVR